MQTEDITTQLNSLSVQDKPRKRRPRRPKNKQAKQDKQDKQDKHPAPDTVHHAQAPQPPDMAPRNARRHAHDPNLAPCVPHDSLPDSSYRSPVFRAINPAATDYPPPTPPIKSIPHPSTFFNPSYTGQPPPLYTQSPTQAHDIRAESVSTFPRSYQPPELAPLSQNTQLRRSTRLAARQSQHQPAKPPNANLLHKPTPPTPAQIVQDPETRTPTTSDKRARDIGKLLRPEPALSYLSNSMVAPRKLDRPKSLFVILDLNGVLVFRKKRSRSYDPRPNLHPFLDYVFANHHVMIWSSGMPENVERIIGNMLSKDQRQKLIAIWSRDTLRLPAALFAQKVQVYKQLSWIWQDKNLRKKAPIGGWSQKDTVLVDDSVVKAAAEPYNLIEVDEFINSPAQEENTTLLDVIKYLEHIRWYDNVSAEMRASPFATRKT